MQKLTGILPWTKSCFVCGEDNPHGLRLRSRVEDGRVVLEYTTRECDVGYRHIVHGGIAMTLLDEVMTWAAIIEMKSMCVAAEMTTRLKHHVRAGQKLRVEGWVAHHSSRLCLTESAILDENGKRLLSAAGKYMAMHDKEAHLSKTDFVKSPDSIDPEEILRVDQ